jgi:hypothetical protein
MSCPAATASSPGASAEGLTARALALRRICRRSLGNVHDVFRADTLLKPRLVTTGTNRIQDQDPLFNFSSTGEYTFTAPGVYGFFCTVGSHCASGERGTITVE